MQYITKNENDGDRLVRLLVAEMLFIGGYFWVGGMWQILLFVLGAVALMTALTGYCPLYTVLKKQTRAADSKTFSRRVVIGLLIGLIVLGGTLSYYSAFFTKKFFLDEYNHMNNYYKQTLFYTGQDKREESIANYNNLIAAYTAFSAKYQTYRPYAIKADAQFSSDLAEVSGIITALREQVYSGDLKQAHTAFESVRPIFQDILKRNNFSLLAVSLVDFHDSMEKIIAAADARDASGLLAVYPEVDEKLKTVEEIANDFEIQAIRTKLEDIATLARDGQADLLSAKAAELKSAFVKVYLSRG